MKLELLALLLADGTTAVAKIGQKTDKGLLVMFEVPFEVATITTEQVQAAVAAYQAKIDTLAGIYDACQPRLVSAPTAVLEAVPPFKPRVN